MLAIRVLIASALLAPLTAASAPVTGENPDQVRLNDGTELRGLILQNTSDMVVLETEKGEARLPKEYIRRIDDAPNGEAIFQDIMGENELPSWRSIVHDMRTHDAVHSFEQIPPTAIDNGFLRNIPYLSFRVNDQWELNVYGSPESPVAIEFGVYGKQRTDSRTLRVFREFIAGHLNSTEQIRALYSLGPERQEARAGKLGFRLIRPEDPDSYGGTWVDVYRPDLLESARLPDKEYAAMTRPFSNVNNPDGSLRSDKKQENISWVERAMKSLTGKEPE